MEKGATEGGGGQQKVVAGFSWVVEGLLAGSAAPGSFPATLADDLAALARAGVTAVVSLNEAHPPLQPESDLRAALAPGGTLRVHLHLPVPDYRPPTLDQMHREFVALVEEQRALGGATLVHCNAGMGRTGTMLAAYLIAAQGVPAREAIATLRRMRPGSVQTFKQEDGLIAFEESLQKQPRPS